MRRVGFTKATALAAAVAAAAAVLAATTSIRPSSGRAQFTAGWWVSGAGAAGAIEGYRHTSQRHRGVRIGRRHRGLAECV